MSEIIERIEGNQVAWHKLKMSLPGHQVFDEQFALWSTSSRPAGSTVVARVRLSEDPEECALEIQRIHRTYQAAKCPARWFFSHLATPAGLSKTLRKLHLMGPQYSPALYLDLDNAKLEAPEHFCEEVLDWSEFETAPLPYTAWFPKKKQNDSMLMVREATQKSPGTSMHLVSRIGGKPACSISLHFHEETMGIYDVVALPEFRGQGAGTAIMRYALRLGRERRANLATLQSYHRATQWYESMGFSHAGRYTGMYYSLERALREGASSGLGRVDL